MLIAADGSHCGLISGGCLESDLAQHAKRVFEEAEPREITYDLSADEDLVWGLGIGCDGVIKLLLQKLSGDDGFGFLEALESAWQERQDGVLGLVTASSDPSCPIGSFAFACGTRFKAGNSRLLENIQQPATIHDLSRRFWRENISNAQGSVDLLLVPVIPPPALLICGAGVDTVPVARLATEMGWDCTVVDHRSGFARAERFPPVCKIRLLQPAELASEITLDKVDAAIMMSHNLSHDRQYLAQVVAAQVAYIGMLGPRTRRDRLLDEINVTNGQDGIHVHGPAGLDIGAEMPESIALSIISEIHACLNLRTGSELTPAGT